MWGLCVTISRQILHITLIDTMNRVITSRDGSLNKFVRRHQRRDVCRKHRFTEKLPNHPEMTFLVIYLCRHRCSVQFKLTYKRVMRQLESILHELHPAGRKPIPGHNIFRQHRTGVGGHISRNYQRR